MWGKYPGDGTTNSNVPVKIMENVKLVSTFQGDISNVSKIAAIKEDGSLWMWGNISVEDVQKAQLTPVSVLEHVKTIQLYECANTAITEDGSLWMWGSNQEGEIGNGTRDEAQLTPLKVLDHVRKVVYRDHSYETGTRYTTAITEDDSLYVWGSNWYNSIATGHTRYYVTPWKMMENVKDVFVSRELPVTKILKKDGGLYLFGNKSLSQVGGINIKLLDQVAAISGTWDALTEDGTLYMWDEVSAQMQPEKMLDGVKSFSSFEYVTRDSTAYNGAHCGYSAVTEDGSLWLWGDNYNGRVGNGTSGTGKDQAAPFKVLDDVRKGSFGWPGCVAYTGDGSLWIWGNAAPQSLPDCTIPQKFTYPDEARTLTESSYGLSVDGAGLDADTDIVLAAQTAEPGSPAQFSGLLANEIYNFYAVKARNTENVLLPDNLLYIGQYTSDGNGGLSVPYVMRESYDMPEVFVVGLARKDLSAAQIVVPDIAYDGSGHVVEADVFLDGETLKEGVDYEIYGTCLVTEPGEYHVEIRGTGEYGGAVDVTFHVKKDGESDSDEDLGDIPGGPGDDPNPDRNDVLPEDVPADGVIPDGIWIAGLDKGGYPYTGAAIKPAVRVYDGKILLTEKTDYTISYRNHTKANDAAVEKTAPTVTVTGKGNYSGKDTAVYRILPLDINGEAFGADDMTLAYNNKAQKPIPALWWDSKKLKNKTDYTVTYYNAAGTSLDALKEAGDYEIELAGTGNFTGKRRIALHVTADLKLMSRMSVAKIPNQTYLDYKGGQVTPAVTVKDGKTVLTEGTHYTVSYSNHTKIGTGYAVVKGLEAGGYSGTKRVSFKITGVSISKATVSGLAGQTFVYGGTDIVPALKLSLKSGSEMQTLTEEYYSVSWQKNRNVGTATVIFTGNQKKGYTGTVKKTFKIQAFNIAGNAEGRFQAELEEKAAPYAKGGSRPKLKVTFKKADGTVETLQEGKDYTLVCTNNKAVNDGSNAGKLPTATVKGKGNFTGTFAQKLNYTITTQDIGKLSMTASDKTYQNKRNIFSTKVSVTDLDGKTLKAGTDYEKQFTYTYKEAVKLDNGTVREAGAAVDKNDIIPAGAVLEVGVTGKGNYTGTLKDTYRISQASISTAQVTIPVQTYTGRRVTPGKSVISVKVKGKPIDSSQYKIVSYQDCQI
ncbi:MAG: hypothetical protein K2I53_09655, partial [Lachnospiraceae bacterium]|nr:hypothetical protein [Lachnospiraceae bacterium]